MDDHDPCEATPRESGVDVVGVDVVGVDDVVTDGPECEQTNDIGLHQHDHDNHNDVPDGPMFKRNGETHGSSNGHTSKVSCSTTGSSHKNGYCPAMTTASQVSDKRQEVQKVAIELALYIILHMTSSKDRPVPVQVTSRSFQAHAKTMLRIVEQLSDRHQIVFASMVRKLNVDDVKQCRQSFESVANEMFSDGQYNWGRVVTLYAFAVWQARYCIEKNMPPKCSSEIAEAAGNYVAQNLSNWIVKQGGWEEMDRFFPEQEDVESKIWKGLFYTVIGLGALATTVAAVR